MLTSVKLSIERDLKNQKKEITKLGNTIAIFKENHFLVQRTFTTNSDIKLNAKFPVEPEMAEAPIVNVNCNNQKKNEFIYIVFIAK